MRREIMVLFSLFSVSGLLLSVFYAIGQPPQKTEAKKFPDAHDAPVSDWRGPVFRLSQNYPDSLPDRKIFPWKQVDFKKENEWKAYLDSVLAYCYRGNVDVEWDVSGKEKPDWFHAPWLHWGRNGREFVHGLTHERVSIPGELARTQTSMFQNWAVSFYNDIGGYTIGKVWRNPDNPDPQAAEFYEGAVAIKLIFTQADTVQVPYLNYAPTWDAHIYKTTVIPTNFSIERTIQKVRLLQIDIAVRDDRADSTGWVFGTFIYNGNLRGDPWRRVIPIGLMWGNDYGVTVNHIRAGTRLKETLLNTSLDVPFQHLGWGNRLNGPIDNPMSSCISCHSTAQWPVSPDSLIPPRSVIPDSKDWMVWFRNIKYPEAFNKHRSSLDYSLQLAAGIRNYYEWKHIVETRGGVSNNTAREMVSLPSSLPSFIRLPVERSGEP